MHGVGVCFALILQALFLYVMFDGVGWHAAVMRTAPIRAIPNGQDTLSLIFDTLPRGVLLYFAFMYNIGSRPLVLSGMTSRPEWEMMAHEYEIKSKHALICLGIRDCDVQD